MMRTDQIQIGYRLTFKTPFHFGTGLRNGLIHRTVSRDSNGYLYVPGSTLKGALRERCEHLAQLFNLRIHEPHREQSALAEFSFTADIVDRIFGSRFRPGGLYFDDVHMVEEDQKLFDGVEKGDRRYLNRQVQQITQVSIARLTRSAKQGSLFTSEFGLRQLRFEGQIYGQLHDFDFPGNQNGTYGLLLLLVGLCSFDRLGGNKSSGAGQLSCELLSLKVNGEIQQPVDWFAELEGLEFYKDEQNEGEI
jgi:CRISPR/Cas system CSM-associated protein Csm3 (group 7 of RAMP superfamily)